MKHLLTILLLIITVLTLTGCTTKTYPKTTMDDVVNTILNKRLEQNTNNVTIKHFDSNQKSAIIYNKLDKDPIKIEDTFRGIDN